MKKCPFCKAPVTQERVEHVHRWNEDLYILRNVPADVCTQCGEVFFAPDALKKMDELVETKRQPGERRSVPVYSF